MYLRSFVVENFGPIRKLRWDAGDVPAGWHVFIGDNGAGKSTLLKALSLAMVGHDGAKVLRIDPMHLVRLGDGEAKVTGWLTEGGPYTWRPGVPSPGFFGGRRDYVPG